MQATTRKKIKFNPKRFFINILTLSVFLFMFIGTLEVCIHTEKYSTTSKYQLENSIKAGNEQAINYYIKTYQSKGINLFED